MMSPEKEFDAIDVDLAQLKQRIPLLEYLQRRDWKARRAGDQAGVCGTVPLAPGNAAFVLRQLPQEPLLSGFLILGRLATSISVTRPNRVRLRYGSQVCFPGFHQADCSTPLLFSYVHE
jgi:hypothetical protein